MGERRTPAAEPEAGVRGAEGAKLTEGGDRVGEEHHSEPREDDVERPRPVKVEHVADFEVLLRAARPVAGSGDHWLAEVDAEDLGRAPAEQLRDSAAGATTDVEH